MPPLTSPRRWLAAVALQLGALSLPSAAAGAQPAADTLYEQAAARVAAAMCGRRVVLLGELPEHGHARGFAIEARIVERLVTRCGFRAALFEAGSYDFFGLERALAGAAPGDAAARAYLDRGALRALGPVRSRLFGKVATTDWSAAFDGVLVVRDESVPAFEPRR